MRYTSFLILILLTLAGCDKSRSKEIVSSAPQLQKKLSLPFNTQKTDNLETKALLRSHIKDLILLRQNKTSDESLFMLDNDVQLEPKMWTILSDSEAINMMGRPVIIIEDQDGKGQVLMSNFANDNFLNKQYILGQVHNGMQINMLLLEQKPKSS